jgi:hypothetical protein
MGVLAPAEQRAAGGEEVRRAEIVVAVHAAAANDGAESLRTGRRVGRELATLYPDRSAVVLLLSDAAPEAPAEAPDPRLPPPRVPVLPWHHGGQSAIEATGEDGPRDGARRLLAPILDDGFDLVCPCYGLHRYQGVLSTGIAYPLTRALFGKRLRQPVSDELAVSRRLAGHLLGEGWHSDPAHAGAGIWLVTGALSHEFKVCQAWVGSRPPRPAGTPADLPDALAKVVGLLFHEMRLHAHAWQRVKGSQVVKTYGEPSGAEEEHGAPQVAPMLSAFQLGFQELQRVWSAVLPPQSLLAVKRLAAAPEERFSMDDGLWARVVYDFAVGYHVGLMDRALLLRSMTPLYLGWTAAFVREVRDLDGPGVEARVERLCRAFEAAKPYLISRWRWPDRFNP